MTILRVADAGTSLPLHDVAGTRRLEAISPTPPTSSYDAQQTDDVYVGPQAPTVNVDSPVPSILMQRAGVAIGRVLLAVAPRSRTVVVAVGPGNNGGDGLEAAAWLQSRGRHVTAVLTREHDRMPVEARHALRRAQDAGVVLVNRWPSYPVDHVIDALLGIGPARPLQGALAQAWRDMHRQQAHVLAVDVPSGLNADTGTMDVANAVVDETNQAGQRSDRPNSPARPAADTLSLLTLKPGLFTGIGRQLGGTLWLDKLGIDTDVVAPVARLGVDGRVSHAEGPRHDRHKGSYGDVAVVGGAPGMLGALRLASRAAVAAGAGRVYSIPLQLAAAGPGSVLTPDDAAPEVMLRSLSSLGDRAWLESAVLLCGCGGGDAVREPLPTLLSAAPRLVLDADALNAIAADDVLQRLLVARFDRGLATVLTPHPLEAARLLGLSDARAIQRDRLSSALRLTERFACVVALKGAGTITSAPGLLPLINATGNGLLATAGTGDVLAGWIAGRWAFEAPPGMRALQATVAGSVRRHGAAADLALTAGRVSSLSASALIGAMTRV